MYPALHWCGDSVLCNDLSVMRDAPSFWRKHLLTANWWEWKHEEVFRLENDRAVGELDFFFEGRWIINECSEDIFRVLWVDQSFPQFASNMHTHTRTHCTYLCVEMTRWEAQPALLSRCKRATVLSWSLQTKQHNPSTSEGPQNRPSQPKKKLEKKAPTTTTRCSLPRKNPNRLRGI